MGKRVCVGRVAVDAGLMWVGDPCYVIGKVGDSDEERSKVESWNQAWYGKDGSFCDTLERMDAERAEDDPARNTVYPFEPGQKVATGIAVSSGWGDGVYPVYVEYEGRRVKSVTVEFMEDDEDEDCDWQEDDEEYDESAEYETGAE